MVGDEELLQYNYVLCTEHRDHCCEVCIAYEWWVMRSYYSITMYYVLSTETTAVRYVLLMSGGYYVQYLRSRILVADPPPRESDCRVLYSILIPRIEAHFH